MTLLTLSKIKRVCSISLVPRLFRGDGCTPGKFHRLRNEDSPVLARSFGKTDWTKPRFVTKPYTDVRSPESLPADVAAKIQLKVTVLSKIIYDHFAGIKRIRDSQLTSRLIESFKFYTNLLNGKLIPTTLNTTTSRSNDEEKLAQKVEVITEVPLVEAEPKSDVLNPPHTLGPSVMTIEDIKAKAEPGIYDAIAQQMLQSPISQVDDKLLQELEKLGSKKDSKPKSDKRVENLMKYETTESPVVGKNESKGASDVERTSTMATPKPDVEEDNPDDENVPEVLEPIATKANLDKKLIDPTPELVCYNTLSQNRDYMVLVDMLRKRANSAMLNSFEPHGAGGILASNVEARNPGCMPPSPHHFSDKSKQVPLRPNIDVKPKGPCPACQPTKQKEPEPQKKFTKIDAEDPIAQISPLNMSTKILFPCIAYCNPYDPDIENLTDLVIQTLHAV